MKAFVIPLINRRLCIYVGSKGWLDFAKAYRRESGEEVSETPIVTGNCGRSFGAHVWVSNLKHQGTLIHELSHAIDEAMEVVGSQDTEFRAYVTAWVLVNVLKWARGK